MRRSSEAGKGRPGRVGWAKSTAAASSCGRCERESGLERALAGNTLVYLETGAGKTLIAVLLLRSFAHRIRSAPPPCFAVFLVPTVVLVSQQARVVQAHTDLRVAQFYGDMGVDFWDADTWRQNIDGAEVLVTPARPSRPTAAQS